MFILLQCMELRSLKRVWWESSRTKGNNSKQCVDVIEPMMVCKNVNVWEDIV